MSDEDAYMALPLNNAQGELHPLEEGMHAIGSGLSQRQYAAKVGKKATTIVTRMQAAAVAVICSDIGADLRPHWTSLSELHPAPRLPPRVGTVDRGAGKGRGPEVQRNSGAVTVATERTRLFVISTATVCGSRRRLILSIRTLRSAV